MANYNIWGAYAQGKKLEEDKGVQAQEQSRADALLLLQKTANMDARDFRNKQLNQQEFESERTATFRAKQEENATTRFNATQQQARDLFTEGNTFAKGINDDRMANAIKLAGMQISATNKNTSSLDKIREDQLKTIAEQQRLGGLRNDLIGQLSSFDVKDKSALANNVKWSEPSAFDWFGVPMKEDIQHNREQVKSTYDFLNYIKRYLMIDAPQKGVSVDTDIQKFKGLSPAMMKQDPDFVNMVEYAKGPLDILLQMGGNTSDPTSNQSGLTQSELGSLRKLKALIKSQTAPLQAPPTE